MGPFWSWLQETPIIYTIGKTDYIYDAFSVLHYFSVFIMVGTTALVDLRVLGVGGQRQSVAQVAKQFTPWIWTAVGVGIVSGFFEFAPGASSFAPDHIFEIKMVVIVLAIVCGLMVLRGARRWSELPEIPAVAKLLAVISILLWLGAILAALDFSAFSGLG
jgi:hypothetical protein